MKLLPLRRHRPAVGAEPQQEQEHRWWQFQPLETSDFQQFPWPAHHYTHYSASDRDTASDSEKSKHQRERRRSRWKWNSDSLRLFPRDFQQFPWPCDDTGSGSNSSSGGGVAPKAQARHEKRLARAKRVKQVVISVIDRPEVATTSTKDATSEEEDSYDGPDIDVDLVALPATGSAPPAIIIIDEKMPPLPFVADDHNCSIKDEITGLDEADDGESQQGMHASTAITDDEVVDDELKNLFKLLKDDNERGVDKASLDGNIPTVIYHDNHGEDYPENMLPRHGMLLDQQTTKDGLRLTDSEDIILDEFSAATFQGGDEVTPQVNEDVTDVVLVSSSTFAETVETPAMDEADPWQHLQNGLETNAAFDESSGMAQGSFLLEPVAEAVPDASGTFAATTSSTPLLLTNGYLVEKNTRPGDGADDVHPADRITPMKNEYLSEGQHNGFVESPSSIIIHDVNSPHDDAAIHELGVRDENILEGTSCDGRVSGGFASTELEDVVSSPDLDRQSVVEDRPHDDANDVSPVGEPGLLPKNPISLDSAAPDGLPGMAPDRRTRPHVEHYVGSFKDSSCNVERNVELSGTKVKEETSHSAPTSLNTAVSAAKSGETGERIAGDITSPSPSPSLPVETQLDHPSQSLDFSSKTDQPLELDIRGHGFEVASEHLSLLPQWVVVSLPSSYFYSNPEMLAGFDVALLLSPFMILFITVFSWRRAKWQKRALLSLQQHHEHLSPPRIKRQQKLPEETPQSGSSPTAVADFQTQIEVEQHRPQSALDEQMTSANLQMSRMTSQHTFLAQASVDQIESLQSQLQESNQKRMEQQDRHEEECGRLSRELKQAMKGFQKERSMHASQVRQLKQDLSGYQKTSKENKILETELEMVRKEHNGHLDRLEQSLADRNATVDQLNRELRKRDENMVFELQSLQNEIRLCNQQKLEVQEQLSRKNEHCNNLDRDVERVTTELANAKNLTDEVKAQFDHQIESIEVEVGVKNALAEAAMKEARLAQEVLDLTSRLKYSQGEFDRLRTTHKESEGRLNGEIDALRAEALAAREHQSKFVASVAKQESLVIQLQCEIEAKKVVIRQQQEQNDELMKSIAESRTRIQKSAVEVRNFETQLSRLENKLKDTELSHISEVLQLKRELEAQQSAHVAAKEAVAQLERRMDARETQIAELSDKLKMNSKQLKEGQTQKEILEKKIQNHKQNTSAQAKSWQRKLDDHKKTVAQLEETKAKSRQELNEKDVIVAGLKAKQEALSADLLQQQLLVASLQREKEALASDLKEQRRLAKYQKKMVDDAKIQLGRKETEHKDLIDKVHITSQEIRQHAVAMDRTTKERTDRLVGLEQQLATSVEQNQLLQTRNASLADGVQQSREKVKSLEEMVQTLTAKVKNQRESSAAQNKASNSKLERQQRALDLATERLGAAEKRLAEKVGECGELTLKVDRLDFELASLKQQVNSMDNLKLQLETARVALAASEEDLRLQVQKNGDLGDLVNDLQLNLKNTAAALAEKRKELRILTQQKQKDDKSVKDIMAQLEGTTEALTGKNNDLQVNARYTDKLLESIVEKNLLIATKEDECALMSHELQSIKERSESRQRLVEALEDKLCSENRTHKATIEKGQEQESRMLADLSQARANWKSMENKCVQLEEELKRLVKNSSCDVHDSDTPDRAKEQTQHAQVGNSTNDVQKLQRLLKKKNEECDTLMRRVSSLESASRERDEISGLLKRERKSNNDLRAQLQDQMHSRGEEKSEEGFSGGVQSSRELFIKCMNLSNRVETLSMQLKNRDLQISSMQAQLRSTKSHVKPPSSPNTKELSQLREKVKILERQVVASRNAPGAAASSPSSPPKVSATTAVATFSHMSEHSGYSPMVSGIIESNKDRLALVESVASFDSSKDASDRSQSSSLLSSDHQHFPP